MLQTYRTAEDIQQRYLMLSERFAKEGYSLGFSEVNANVAHLPAPVNTYETAHDHTHMHFQQFAPDVHVLHALHGGPNRFPFPKGVSEWELAAQLDSIDDCVTVTKVLLWSPEKDYTVHVCTDTIYVSLNEWEQLTPLSVNDPAFPEFARRHNLEFNPEDKKLHDRLQESFLAYLRDCDAVPALVTPYDDAGLERIARAGLEFDLRKI